MKKAIILAAGKGTRFNSDIPKPMHKLLDISMLDLLIMQLKKAHFKDIIVVVGYKKEMIIENLHFKKDVIFVEQKQQLGTANALLSAKKYLSGNTLVISADTPLITDITINEIFNSHLKNNSDITLVTAEIDNTKGYGRIIRNNKNKIIEIIEEIDCDQNQKKIREVNSGIYIINFDKISVNEISNINNNNNKKEFYLTDILKSKFINSINSFLVKDISEIFGINDRKELFLANKILQKRINLFWIKQGNTITNPDIVFISPFSELGRDNILDGNIFIYGKSKLYKDNFIQGNTYINNSHIKNNNNIMSSYILESYIGNSNNIGPFTHLRKNNTIGDNNRLGNFVEVKNSNLESNVKVSHLSYIGDTNIESEVNIGCGSITANYNGFTKYKTYIHKKSFIGTNCTLIAPLEIGENTFIAAGSIINKNVPNNALYVTERKGKVVEDKGKELKIKYKKGK